MTTEELQDIFKKEIQEDLFEYTLTRRGMRQTAIPAMIRHLGQSDFPTLSVVPTGMTPTTEEVAWIS
jgi:hypothetical protein